MDYTRAWALNAQTRQYESEDSSPTHLCHYQTKVSLTGDMTAPVPATVVTRAALLCLIHSLDDQKIQACYEALAALWSGETSNHWIEPQRNLRVSSALAPAERKSAVPHFLED